MAAIGRILQLAGWLWFAAFIAAPALGLRQFSIFPAIILIFVARALRTQARRRQGEEIDDHSSPPEFSVEESVTEERPLNTERLQAPDPRPLPPPSPRVEPTPEPDPLAEDEEHNEILEKLLGSNEASERSTTPTIGALGDDGKPSMTSAEMIAEARKRWDRSD